MKFSLNSMSLASVAWLWSSRDAPSVEQPLEEATTHFFAAIRRTLNSRLFIDRDKNQTGQGISMESCEIYSKAASGRRKERKRKKLNKRVNDLKSKHLSVVHGHHACKMQMYP